MDAAPHVGKHAAFIERHLGEAAAAVERSQPSSPIPAGLEPEPAELEELEE